MKETDSNILFLKDAKLKYESNNKEKKKNHNYLEKFPK